MSDNTLNKFPEELSHWIQTFPLPFTERPSWDEYFLLLAYIVSRRSSCLRTKVGAVIVKERDVISTGYNGAPTGQPNCIDLNNCYRNDNKIESGTQLERCRASGSHAESNSIALAAKNGHSTHEATLYLYGHTMVCNMCRGIITNAHLKEVIHLKDDGTVEFYNINQDWGTNILDEE